MTYLAFDIDGTIFDCSDFIVQAFQDGILRFEEQCSNSIKVPSKERIVSVLGQPTDSIFQELFPGLTELETQRINDLCTISLTEMINNGGGSLFDDVYSMLEKFHREEYVLLIASNGRIEYIEAILKSNDLMKFFPEPIIAINGKVENKTDIVKYYRENVSKNNLIIMIGDRDSDRLAAGNNNIQFIGCVFGHADKTELEGAKWIAHEFGSIYKIVKEIEKNHR